MNTKNDVQLTFVCRIGDIGESEDGVDSVGWGDASCGGGFHVLVDGYLASFVVVTLAVCGGRTLVDELDDLRLDGGGSGIAGDGASLLGGWRVMVRLG